MRQFAFAAFFILGLCTGSFLNVLIYRIPKGEEFVHTRSHCMNCGHILSWYEMIPVVSWVAQGGRCRCCGCPLSIQYPLVEGVTGAAWLCSALLHQGDVVPAVLDCVLFSALLVLAVIDWRTFQIPNGCTIAVLLVGVVSVALSPLEWLNKLIGLCCVSVPFLVLWLMSKGTWIGLGDVKLMAAAGLYLGAGRTLLALILGCFVAIPVHLLRMRLGAGNKLAFGPYLAVGIWISALFGEAAIQAYLSLFGL